MRRSYHLMFIFLFTAGLQAFSQVNSANGEVFTPRGDIRFLIVCIGFEGYDYDQDFKNWPAGQEFPDYIIDNTYPEAFFSDYSQFEEEDTLNNLSTYYHEMSKGKLRIVADVYPRRININPKGSAGRHVWRSFNQKAIKKMKETDPDFDWSPYDQRKNRPNFKFDNSDTGPDGKPDYIIFYYRYTGAWKKELEEGLSKYTASGGRSKLEGIHNEKYGNYTITSAGFFVNGSATETPGHFKKLFRHELAHELFASPHFFGANGAVGNYFYAPNTGWGSAITTEETFYTMNAWERWLLGWTEVSCDLSSPQRDTVITLDDFVTTGDAARITLPVSGQRLWIENHQLISPSDDNSWEGKLVNMPEGSDGIGSTDKGVYMYIEDMLDARENASLRMVSDMKRVNGMRWLNAQGNHDYTTKGEFTKTWDEYWKNTMFHFERGAANPYGGINPLLRYRLDADSSGKLDHRTNFNTADTESYKIVKEKVDGEYKLLYGNHGSRNATAKQHRRSIAFREGDVINGFSNPPLTSYPQYGWKKDRINPRQLEGVQVEILSIDEGKAKLKISFQHTKLDHDLRIAGDIMLSQLTKDTIRPDLTISEGKQVTVNKSMVPNRIQGDEGSFVNETHLLLADQSLTVMEKKACMLLEDASMLKIKDQAKLKILKRGRITVTDQSVMTIAEGSAIAMHRRSRLKVQDEATVTFKAGSFFNGQRLSDELTLKNGRYRPKKIERMLKKL